MRLRGLSPRLGLENEVVDFEERQKGGREGEREREKGKGERKNKEQKQVKKAEHK